jgi:tRNA (adenine37-N6)-methyltransferase
VPTFEPIGRVRSAHTDSDAAPNQASHSPADATAVIEIRPRYADALLGLDRYEHVWVLTWLHDQPEDPPLRLVPEATRATGAIQGVFASRAPHRPNPIGLSLVQLLDVDDLTLTVSGVDLLDGTPVLDIKPWFADCDLP